MKSYPCFNQETKAFFWKLIEKYNKLFPDFADALSECIQNNITDDNLGVIRLYEFGNFLEDSELQEMRKHMNRYYDYVSDIAYEEYCREHHPEWFEYETS
jgi:hypothetical protein